MEIKCALHGQVATSPCEIIYVSRVTWTGRDLSLRQFFIIIIIPILEFQI